VTVDKLLLLLKCSLVCYVQKTTDTTQVN